MANIPDKSVTFLFTDIDNSSEEEQKYSENFEKTLLTLQEVFREVVSSNNGFIFKISGSAFYCSFKNSTDAVNTAINVQMKSDKYLIHNDVKLKMGIHHGDADWTGDDYSGYFTLAYTQRVMSSANGCQIIITDEAHKNFFKSCPEHGKPDLFFRDLGLRKLKDINHPVKLYHIVSPQIETNFLPIRTIDFRPNNLPVQLTNFIGREKEIEEIKTILNNSRFITLFGSGGTGKTRLSLKTAEEVIDEFQKGVWLVELETLNDASLIAGEIASVFNLKEESGRRINEIIINYLKEKHLLLIFDNCEHLIDECAHICREILISCSNIKILTSSRETLKVDGEIIFKVPSLSLPDPKKSLSPETVKRYEAVQLFIDRAINVKPDFEITEKNANALAMLCYHLDGIPLAIELAAARVKIYPVESILDNLSNRFQILKGGSSNALPRQQTLRALIDWSYDLLTEKEKLFFSRLSVFSGGWNIESAEEICSGEGIDKDEVLDLMSALLEKSIIITFECDGTMRYKMLESIREYSCEKLVSKNEIRKKHFKYFLEVSNGGDDTAYNSRVEWKKIMNIDEDNLRSAVKWAMENFSSDSALLIKNVSDWWELDGNFREAFDLLNKVLNLKIDIEPEAKAKIFFNAAYFASQLEENETAEKYILEGLEYFRSKNDKKHIAEGMGIYGIILFLRGKFDEAVKCHEEGLKLLEGQNDRQMEANLKGSLAAFYASAGKMELSLKCMDESIEVNRQFDNREMLAKLLVSKGGFYYQTGDLKKAESVFMEGLPLLEEMNDRYSVASTFYNLGNVLFALNNYSKSSEYYEKAMAIAKEFGLTGIYDRSHIKLGEIALNENEQEKAKQIFSECLKHLTKDSEKLKLNLSIYGLGKYYYHESNYKNAARYFLLSDRINEDIHYKFSKSRTDEHEVMLDEIRNNLGEEIFEQIRNEVSMYDLGNAADIALSLNN